MNQLYEWILGILAVVLFISFYVWSHSPIGG